MVDGFPHDKSKYVYYFLIFSIFIGIFVRFWGLGDSWLEGDEPLNIVSAIKLNHAGNPYDPRFFSYEHPPVARWFIGLPTRIIDADYSLAMNLPINMFVWAYMVPSKDVYIPMRTVSAAFGMMSVLLVFLITRKLFGFRAGIWSALSISLSFDLIFYSRWLLPESITVGLALLTLYFYLRYLEEKKTTLRLVFMLLTALVFTLTLGTRSFTPLFLFPILVLSQFLINQKKPKENMLFTFLLIIGIFSFLIFIWPAAVRDLAQKMWGVYGVSDILAFSLPEVVLSNIFRNSYIYLAGLLLIIYEGFNFLRTRSYDAKTQHINIHPVIGYFKSAQPSLIPVIFLIISVIGFGFTKYANFRYEVILFIPVYILSGKVLEKAANNKRILMFLIFLIFVNFYFFMNVYPYYAEYRNFSLKCGDYSICSSEGYYNHFPELKQALTYLETAGNPPVMTTEFNIMTFYEGSSIPLIASYDSRCNPDDVRRFAEKYKYIVYWGGRGGQPDLRDDPYMCEYLRKMPMDYLTSFGNYSQPSIDPEVLKVKIYALK